MAEPSSPENAPELVIDASIIDELARVSERYQVVISVSIAPLTDVEESSDA